MQLFLPFIYVCNFSLVVFHICSEQPVLLSIFKTIKIISGGWGMAGGKVEEGGLGMTSEIQC